MASWSKGFLLEFIELYKTLEPLWLTKSKDYLNKNKRNTCYDLLLQKILTIEPTATRDTVTRKINNLRGAFRKEHRKVQASLLSGASSDDLYVPRLWYYNELLFLKDQEPLQSTSNINYSLIKSPINEESDFDNTWSDSYQRPESSLSSGSRSFKRKKTPSDSNVNNTQENNMLCVTADPLSSFRQDDEFDIIGKNIAIKLRSMDHTQKLFAEKIINDTLFEAQLNNLSRHSRLTNPHVNK